MAKARRRRGVRGPESQPQSPFERVSGLRKLAALGSSAKGTAGNRARAHASGVRTRERTIKPQLRRERAANAFVDRRIGAESEGADAPNAGAEAESKRLKRLERIRRKQLAGSKKQRFNVGDGEEDTLTHLGHSIAELGDDFDGQNEIDDHDGREGDLFARVREGEMRNREASGESEDAGARPKTKKERLQEIIARSKEQKAERQREKEKEKDQVAELDQSFKQLQEQGVALPLRHKQPPSLKGFTEEGAEVEAESIDASRDFDTLAREMASDSRGQAAERTLTEEEAEELRQREAEELERKRMKRAERNQANDDDAADNVGEEDDDEEDADAPAGGFALRRYKKRKRQQQKQGNQQKKVQTKTTNDELLDAAEGSLKQSAEDGGAVRSDQEGWDEDHDEDVDSEDEIGADGEGDESTHLDEARPDLQQGIELLREKGVLGKYGVEQEFVPSSGENQRNISESRAQRIHDSEDMQGIDSEGGINDESDHQKEEHDDLNHTEDNGRDSATTLPQSLDSLKHLLVDADAGQTRKMLMELIAKNPPGKSNERRKQLQAFFAVMFAYFDELAGSSDSTSAAIDACVLPLLELANRFPYFAALSCKERLRRMHDGLRERLSKGSGKQWPHPRTFLLLRLFHLLFPTSDFKHAVLTPSSLLIGEMLALCPLSNAREAALAVYCCDLAREIATANARLFPEALDMLAALLHSACGSAAVSSVPGHVAHRMKPAVLKTNFTKIKEPLKQLPLLEILHCSGTAAPGKRQEVKARTLAAVLRSIQGFAMACESMQAAPEMFQPLLDAVQSLGSKKKLSEQLESLRSETEEQLQIVVQKAHIRPTVQLLEKKQKEIPMYNPKFVEGGIELGKDNDVDRSKAERRKLLKQHKQEKRGAKRELRKDGRYLAQMRESERAENDRRRLSSQRSFYAALESQEHDMKSGGTSGTWIGGPKASAPAVAGTDNQSKRRRGK